MNPYDADEAALVKMSAIQRQFVGFQGGVFMATDMNKYEGKHLRAKHKPSGTWHFACLSGIRGSRSPGVYRVDPQPGQYLEEFELWIVEVRDDIGPGHFRPLERVNNVTAIYS